MGFILYLYITSVAENINKRCRKNQYKKAIRISIAYRPLETCLWGGGLSSNFVHQMCHQGGGEVLSSNFVHQMCHRGEGVLSSNFVHQMYHQGGEGGSLVPTLSISCATRGGPKPDFVQNFGRLYLLN